MQKYFLLLFVLIAFCSGQKEEEAEECEEKNCEEERNKEYERSRSADSYRSEPSRYTNSRSPSYYSNTRSFDSRQSSTFGGTFGGRPAYSSNSRPQSRSLFDTRAPERRESGSTRSFTIDLPFPRPQVPRLNPLPQLNFPDLRLGDLASRLGASERRYERPEARFSEPEPARTPERQSPRVEYVPAEVEYVQRKIELVPKLVDPEPSYAVQRDSGFSARSLPGFPDSAAEGRSRSTYESSRWGSPGGPSYGSFTRSGYSTSSSTRSGDYFPRVSSRLPRPTDFASRGISRFSDLLDPYRESSSSYSRYDGGRGESRRGDSKKDEEENEKQ